MSLQITVQLNTSDEVKVRRIDGLRALWKVDDFWTVDAGDLSIFCPTKVTAESLADALRATRR